MERRNFLKVAGAGTLGGLVLAACNGDDETATTTGDPDLDDALQASDLPELNWEIATSWPTSLDTIFGGAQIFADRVTKMTGGKFSMTARAAGELVPGLEVLPSVQSGAVQAGHTASYYYVGLADVVAFGTALPFGLTARQQNAWLYEGGGLDLLQQIYRDRFGIETSYRQLGEACIKTTTRNPTLRLLFVGIALLLRRAGWPTSITAAPGFTQSARTSSG